jgi:GT2 family glycosyltransferase
VRPLIEDLIAQGAALVYVVDNSPDSFDTFHGWTPHERVIPLKPGRNVGYGRGNNLAIRMSVALHKYHLICNPDIALQPNTLVRLYGALERRPEVGLCMPRVVGPDGTLQYLCKRAPRPLDYLSAFVPIKSWNARRRTRLEMRDQPYDREMDVECLSGCFMFFRSSVLAALQGFDERYFLYFEDFDLSRRARLIARNLYYPCAQVTHAHAREHQQSLRVRLYFMISAVRYFTKWGWFG